MRTYEISSPYAAELYFRNSAIGRLTTLLAETLGTLRARRPARRARPGATARRASRPTVERMSWLDRLDGWFWRQERKAREAYLAQSRDVFDLERRIEALGRGRVTRYC
ncbi:MAG TPA: DUF3563 family protein [Casimicrobiaceae bacterium]